jgi:hypothetical protein
MMQKSQHGKSQAWVLGLILFLTSALLFTAKSEGYIMPAEQLIQFMAANFSKLETVVITRLTRVGNETGELAGERFEEKIWMRSPNFFRSELLGPGVERHVLPDNFYMQLLVANPQERLTQLLSGLGINLQSVAFTRIDGMIAYRIGDKAPERPKILIEKERFLPILLVYGSSAGSEHGTITVRFEAYRKLEQGWYPFETTYSYGDEIMEKYTILTLEPNVPVHGSLFEIPAIKPDPGKILYKDQETTHEERLKQHIRTFEEKYP